MRDKSVSKTRSATWLTQKKKKKNVRNTKKTQQQHVKKLKWVKNVCLTKGMSGKMTWYEYSFFSLSTYV